MGWRFDCLNSTYLSSLLFDCDIWEVSFPFLLFSHLVKSWTMTTSFSLQKFQYIFDSSNFDEDLPSVFALHDLDNNSLF